MTAGLPDGFTAFLLHAVHPFPLIAFVGANSGNPSCRFLLPEKMEHSE
jgi:hypothetical protein